MATPMGPWSDWEDAAYARCLDCGSQMRVRARQVAWSAYGPDDPDACEVGWEREFRCPACGCIEVEPAGA